MRPRRNIRRVLSDERGVSIVFAMLLLVVLLILGGIILSYGYSEYRRATQDVSDQQAGYNVRSATELVYQQFGDKADWAVAALGEARSASSTGGSAERTLSVQGDAASFTDVTVRVRYTAGSSYDVSVFERDAMGADGRVNGLAYHFTVSYTPASGRTPSTLTRGTPEKVGQ